MHIVVKNGRCNCIFHSFILNKQLAILRESGRGDNIIFYSNLVSSIVGLDMESHFV